MQQQQLLQQQQQQLQLKLSQLSALDGFVVHNIVDVGKCQPPLSLSLSSLSPFRTVFPSLLLPLNVAQCGISCYQEGAKRHAWEITLMGSELQVMCNKFPRTFTAATDAATPATTTTTPTQHATIFAKKN